MMQEKIDQLCEMAKKVGVSDKTIVLMKEDLSKSMGGDSYKEEMRVDEPKIEGAKIEIEATGKGTPDKDAIKKALELLTNSLSSRF